METICIANLLTDWIVLTELSCVWDQNSNAICVFFGWDCCCSAKASHCSLLWKGTCVFQSVIEKANLFGQWVVSLPVGCMWDSQLSGGGSPMGFDTCSDKADFVFRGGLSYALIPWMTMRNFFCGGWGSSVRWIHLSKFDGELQAVNCEPSTVRCKLLTVSCELWN